MASREQEDDREKTAHITAADQLAAEAAGGAEASDQDPNRLLDLLRTELEEAKDRLMRSQAELDNYRKRAARQMEDERRYAHLPLLRDLLPVLDNLERAIDAADKNHDINTLLEGVKMVAKQFETVLQQYHCLKIPTLNETFDPHLHEALMQQPSDREPPNTVIAVVRQGFQLHDRVVRPSQVIVSTGSAAPDGQPSDT